MESMLLGIQIHAHGHDPLQDFTKRGGRPEGGRHQQHMLSSLHGPTTGNSLSGGAVYQNEAISVISVQNARKSNK